MYLSKHTFSLSSALSLLGMGDFKNFTSRHIVTVTVLYRTEVVEILCNNYIVTSKSYDNHGIDDNVIFMIMILKFSL